MLPSFCFHPYRLVSTSFWPFYSYFSIVYGQPSTCDEWASYFNCDTVTSCMDSSGVCTCANGNQCVWTNYGAQRVNCPCYDQSDANSFVQPANTGAADYCLTVFTAQNCGYDTTCNPSISTATCRCPDGSNCIWNDGIYINCPCPGSYLSIASYKTLKLQECGLAVTTNNCPIEGVIHCQNGIGTCKCNDGSLCAWGPSYSVNCPCA